MSFSSVLGRVGAVERRSPVPPGRYWVDVFEPAQAAFRAWLEEHAAHVRVVNTSSHEPVGGYPARDWYLFEVIAPVPWEGPGFPTIASSDVKSSQDTADRPPPEPDFAEKLGDLIPDFKKLGEEAAKIGRIVTIAAILAGGLFVWSRGRR